MPQQLSGQVQQYGSLQVITFDPDILDNYLYKLGFLDDEQGKPELVELWFGQPGDQKEKLLNGIMSKQPTMPIKDYMKEKLEHVGYALAGIAPGQQLQEGTVETVIPVANIPLLFMVLNVKKGVFYYCNCGVDLQVSVPKTPDQTGPLPREESFPHDHYKIQGAYLKDITALYIYSEHGQQPVVMIRSM